MAFQTQKSRHSNDLYVQWLILILTLLVAAIIILSSSYQEHGNIEQKERDRLATQAKVIDENLTWQLNGTYQALAGIRRELPLWSGKIGLEQSNQRLKFLADSMPGVLTFLATDATGKIIFSNRDSIIGHDVSRREYFQIPFKNPNLDTLYISPPFKSLLGNFVINVGLIIPGPKGEFNGVITAALDPKYFTVLLGSVLYASDMLADLVHGDGKLFLRVPSGENLTGLDLTGPAKLFSRHMTSVQKDTVFIGSAVSDDDVRIMAQRTIWPLNVHMDKPLVVGVSRDLSSLFAHWRRDAIGKAALFVALALTTTLALNMYQRRQQKFNITSARFLEELLQAKEIAISNNEAKDRLLITVAHEFRTPLSLLTSSTGILDKYGERLSDEEQDRQIGNICYAAQQMSDLIDSVLRYNGPESPPPQHAQVLVDVGQFCRVLAERLKLVYCSGHTFNVSISDDCGTILLNEILFQRVVENLLSNAFRYTQAGGTVSLNVNRENDRLFVVVTDSGIGIPEKDHKLIFEQFYRCQNVEARRGLGLGLFIVNDAISRLDGTITVDSVIGAGTTMQIEIPVVTDQM